MRRLVVWTVLLSLLVLPTVAYGEEAPEPEDEVVPIERGDRAPFTGQLFPTELAIRMGMRIERLELRLQADVERERRSCEIRLEFESRRLALEQERRDFEIQQLTERVEHQAEELAQARITPWYRGWGFAFAMGVVGSIILVGGAVALMVGLT
jgi:hypothetical protein